MNDGHIASVLISLGSMVSPKASYNANTKYVPYTLVRSIK